MNISDRLNTLPLLGYDPCLMQRAALDVLSKVTNGEIDIVDASNPFVFTLETSAVNTAYFLQHNKLLNRKQYAESAMTIDDLYMHMSDKDYIDRFATPSYTYFTLAFQKDELLGNMILDPVTGIKKLTIPRNSEFSIANHKFSLQYPIDIRQMKHGGIQIVYDTTIKSPLYEIDSNVIDYDEIRAPDGSALIKFKFIVHQFDIITIYNQINSSAGFESSVAFDDQFYYCRIYLMDNYGKYREIYTTHSDQIYDSSKPTAILKVLDKSVDITIPSVYTMNEMVRGNLRIDCYQTKGNSQLIMNNYKLNDFSARWLNIDDNDSTEYSSAINSIKNILLYSDVNTNGGRDELSLEELRTRVINNAIGPKQIPITNVQLESDITDAGYDVIKNIDSITNRVFLASKEMPEPIDNTLVTSAGASMSRVTTNLSDLKSAKGVISTNNRIIITSDSLFINDNGIIKLVSNENYDRINNLSNFKKVEHLNSNNYLYTPFNYVLDINNSQFNCRPYILDNPIIETKSYIDSNNNSDIQVNISSEYLIEKKYNGYKLTIKVKSNDVFKNIDSSKLYCQLCYKASNQYIYSYLLGKEIMVDPNDNERVYEFDLLSSFDINLNDQLSQDSFRYSNVELSSYSDLTQVMDVLFITTDTSMSELQTIESDSLLGKHQLPSSAKVITHEQLRINFGQKLSNLWSRTKSISANIEYQKYEEDIYATYLEDKYDIDPVTGTGFSVVNGELIYNLIAKKGDYILDSSGEKILKYPKGTVILDNSGTPIPKLNDSDYITRYIDILTIDAIYKFSTDTISYDYRKLLVNSLVNWITIDIPRFNLKLLDQTKIYFYPKVTQGWISADVGDNTLVNLEANQTFNVTLYVTKNVYNNKPILIEFEKIGKKIIKDHLKNKSIIISDIQNTMKLMYGNDVVGIEVEGLSSSKYNAISVNDKTSKFSIKKKLVVLPNNIIIIEEDVNFNYIILEN